MYRSSSNLSSLFHVSLKRFVFSLTRTLQLIKKQTQLNEPPKVPAVLLVGEATLKEPAPPEKKKKKKKKKKKSKSGEDEEDVVSEDEEDEIPIERCIWMWETEDGWEQYSKEVSLSLRKWFAIC
jgi:hypothetical protein